MKINNDRFAPLVAASGAGAPYRHVSEGFAKHLPYQHPYSTKRHPVDQAHGMMPEGVVICSDGYFFANERIAAYQAKNGGAADYPANGEVIALCEWPTYARIRSVLAIPTLATMDPGSGTVDSFNTTYFPTDTVAAFPAFTLRVNDPNDADFVPIPLLDTITTTFNVAAPGSGTVDVTRQQLSLAAMIYGFNTRPDPLIIECVLGGNVVANSGLALFCEFVKPHT